MGSGLEISFFNQPLLEHLTDRCVMNIYMFFFDYNLFETLHKPFFTKQYLALQHIP